ncbi:Serine/threonine-protein kinase smg1 [Balamuthia mandrillaris]
MSRHRRGKNALPRQVREEAIAAGQNPQTATQFVHNLFLSLETSPGTASDQLSCLRALTELMKGSKKEVLDSVVPLLTPKLCKMLEQIEDSKVLPPFVKLLVDINQNYSVTLRRHFRTTVDLLVGWALDTQIDGKRSRIIVDGLAALHPLWGGSNLSFSYDLLSKFTLDMENLASYRSIHAQQIKRFLRFLGCFLAVVRGLGDNFAQNHISLKLISRLMTCFGNIHSKYYHRKFVLEVNKAIVAFAHQLGNLFGPFFSQAMELMLSHIDPPPESATLQELLSYHAEIVELYSCLPSSILPRVAATIFTLVQFSSSPYKSLRLSNNSAISGAVRRIYQALLQSTNPDVVDALVKSCIDEFNQYYAHLYRNVVEGVGPRFGLQETSMEGESTASPSSSSTTGSAMGVMPSLREIISVIQFDVALLLFAIANTAGRDQLKPQQKERILYALMLHHPLSDSAISRSSPLQFSLLAALRSLSDRQRISVLGTERYRQVVSVMISTLEVRDQPKLQLYALQWLDEQAQQWATHRADRSYHPFRPFPKQLLKAMLTLTNARNDELRSAVASVLLKLARLMFFDEPSQLDWITQLSMFRLGDLNKDITKIYLEILTAIAMVVVLKPTAHISSAPESRRDRATPLGPITDGRWKFKIMTQESTGQFQPHHFQRVMSFLGQREEEQTPDWLVRIFHSCQEFAPARQAASKQGNKLEWLRTLVDTTDQVSMFWALWESARLCIERRLHTPLGGPVQTFQVIERMLAHYTALPSSTTLPTNTSSPLHQTSSPRQGSTPPDESSSARHQLPLRMLLLLLDLLEKQIYCSYEGSLLLDFRPSKSSVEFFRTNRKVCADLFSRMRHPVMRAATAGGSYPDYIEHTLRRLLDLKLAAQRTIRPFNRKQRTTAKDKELISSPATDIARIAKELEMTVVQLTSAFIRLKQADPIIGLSRWLRDLLDLTSSPPTLLVANNNHPQEGTDSDTHTRSLGISKLLLSILQAAYLQSRGHYEAAIDNYKRVLSGSEEPLPNLQMNSVAFVVDQTTECFVKLADWEGLIRWLHSLKSLRDNYANQPHGSTAPSSGLPFYTSFMPRMDLNYVQALSRYDQEQYDKASLFMDRAVLRNTPQELLNPWRCLHNSEHLLLRFLITSQSSVSSPAAAASCPATTSSVSSSTLQRGPTTSIPTDPQEHLLLAKDLMNSSIRLTGMERVQATTPFLVQLHCIRMLQKDTESNAQSNEASNSSAVTDAWWVTSNSLDPRRHDVGDWNKIARVSRFKMHQGHFDKESYHELCVQLAKLARKQGNYRMAHRVLSQCNEESLHTAFEKGKLLKAQGDPTKAVLCLWDITRNQKLSMAIPTARNSQSQHLNSAFAAKVFLKLARWLQSKDSGLDADLLYSRMVVRVAKKGSASEKRSPEALSGVCLEQAIQRYPQHAQSWFRYGRWSYQQGHNLLERAAFEENEPTPLLTAEEATQLQSVIDSEEDSFQHWVEVNRPQDDPAFIKAETLKKLQRLVTLMEDFELEDISSPQQTFEEKNVQALISACPWASSSSLSSLLRLWEVIQNRLLKFYSLAVESYFKFLHLGPSDTLKNGVSIVDCTCGENITATLRILRLLIKYGRFMKRTFDEGFSSTPPGPWQGIIPQLFARLGHPSSYVQQQVLSLVCKIGQASPHLLVYPAVVGNNAQQAAITGQFPSNLAVSKQFQSIVSSLQEHSPQLITEVQSMISELTRITLLWEEHCLITLQNLMPDVASRIRKLKTEILRVDANIHLTHTEKDNIIEAKYTVIMKPAIVQLERLVTSVSGTAETPHEERFQATFLASMNKALERFQSPQDPGDPEAAWTPWKELLELFKKYRPASLKLADLSPKLANMRSSVISMPGLSGNNDKGQGTVTIHSFADTVGIIPTKTKPKKIKLIGSDGSKYTYLLKGREDLHLDERIMQFLGTINQRLAKDKESHARGLRARNYAVIPLSQQSGLIQWVEGAIPLFATYKAWQRRAKTRQRRGKSKRGRSHISRQRPTPPELPKPSDMFYAKIIPALKKKGITNIMSRRDWPFDVLKHIFVQLVKETPRWILSKELWCSSSTAEEWWNKTQVYNRSVAVTSMIGYIIGLGDRHLDNILMDFASGQVVHIDYNVCFEKGLRLKVPERVPFRMTQNMQEALGLTGVEGMFRVGCEQVLHVMRRSKETLLTLLEAFVYDPLVDWAADRVDEAERKTMELNVSLSLFASRIEEMKVPLKDNRDTLVNVLSELINPLQSFYKYQPQEFLLRADIYHTNELLLENKKLITKLKQHIVHDNKQLFKRTQECAELVALKKEKLDPIEEMLAVTLLQQERFERAVQAVKGPLVPALLNLTSPTSSSSSEGWEDNKVLLDLLDSEATESVDGQLRARAVQLEQKMAELQQMHKAYLMNIAKCLDTYRTAVLQFGSSNSPVIVEYAKLSSCHVWANYLRQAVGHAPAINAVSSARELLLSGMIHKPQTEAEQVPAGSRYDALVNQVVSRWQDLSLHLPQQLSQLASLTKAEQDMQHKRAEALSILAQSQGNSISRALNFEKECLGSLLDILIRSTYKSSKPDVFYSLCENAAALLRFLKEAWSYSSSTIANELASHPLLLLNDAILPHISRLIADYVHPVFLEVQKAIDSADTSVRDCMEAVAEIAKRVIMVEDRVDEEETDALPELEREFEELMLLQEGQHSYSSGQVLLLALNKLFSDLQKTQTQVQDALMHKMSKLDADYFSKQLRLRSQKVFFCEKVKVVHALFDCCSRRKVVPSSTGGFSEREQVLVGSKIESGMQELLVVTPHALDCISNLQTGGQVGMFREAACYYRGSFEQAIRTGLLKFLHNYSKHIFSTTLQWSLAHLLCSRLGQVARLATITHNSNSVQQLSFWLESPTVSCLLNNSLTELERIKEEWLSLASPQSQGLEDQGEAILCHDSLKAYTAAYLRWQAFKKQYDEVQVNVELDRQDVVHGWNTLVCLQWFYGLPFNSQLDSIYEELTSSPLSPLLLQPIDIHLVQKSMHDATNKLRELLEDWKPCLQKYFVCAEEINAAISGKKSLPQYCILKKRYLEDCAEKMNNVIRLGSVLLDLEESRKALPSTLVDRDQAVADLDAFARPVAQQDAVEKEILKLKELISQSASQLTEKETLCKELETRRQRLNSQLHKLEEQCSPLRKEIEPLLSRLQTTVTSTSNSLRELYSLLSGIVEITTDTPNAAGGINQIHSLANTLHNNQRVYDKQLRRFITQLATDIKGRTGDDTNSASPPSSPTPTPSLSSLFQGLEAGEFVSRLVVATGHLTSQLFSLATAAKRHVSYHENSAQVVAAASRNAEVEEEITIPPHATAGEEEEGQEEDEGGYAYEEEDEEELDDEEENSEMERTKYSPSQEQDKEGDSLEEDLLASSQADIVFTSSPFGFVNKEETAQSSALPQQQASKSVSNNRSTGQERNTYAVKVLKRVKAKLEGRHLQASSSSREAASSTASSSISTPPPLSVPEQVDQVILEATNVDNLCTMYEGWTAWI